VGGGKQPCTPSLMPAPRFPYTNFDPQRANSLSAPLFPSEGPSPDARLVTLRWLAMFYARWPWRLESHLPSLFPMLLRVLSDNNAKVRAQHAGRTCGTRRAMVFSEGVGGVARGGVMVLVE